MGLRAIIAYKLAKGVLQLVLATALFAMLLGGLAGRAHDFAAALRHHASAAWSIRVADLLLRQATPVRLELTSLALALDGALSCVEAWALRRRHWWGPWLVVVASGSLLPYELYEIARHPHVGRVALFAVNLAIVLYLARKAVAERRAHRAGPT